MSDAEEFAGRLRGHIFVNDTTVIGNVVMATRKRSLNDDVATFSKSLERGWAMAMYEPNEDGDLFLFVPLEWFQ